jgi:hypothetical protein
MGYLIVADVSHCCGSLTDRGTAIILAIWSLNEHLSEVMPVGVAIFSNISMAIRLVFQQHV